MCALQGKNLLLRMIIYSVHPNMEGTDAVMPACLSTDHSQGILLYLLCSLKSILSISGEFYFIFSLNRSAARTLFIASEVANPSGLCKFILQYYLLYRLQQPITYNYFLPFFCFLLSSSSSASLGFFFPVFFFPSSLAESFW